MGPEAFINPLMYLGMTSAALLAYRSAQSRSRPFALPTLVASALWAWCGAVRFRKPDYFWTYYFLSFVFAAIVFGTFAIAVKWLQEQRDRQAEQEEQNASSLVTRDPRGHTDA